MSSSWRLSFFGESGVVVFAKNLTICELQIAVTPVLPLKLILLNSEVVVS
jgi:hypothetical protein